MRWKSDGRRYGAVAMAMHWATALAIFILLGSGLTLAGSDDPSMRLSLLKLHAPFGLFVLLLTVLRILWWLFADRKPSTPSGTPGWQATAAKAVHLLFYLVILAMGASGIGMIVLSGAGTVLVSGAGSLPRFSDLAPHIPHVTGAYAMMALILMHVGAALYHQFLLKDNLLARMGLTRA